MTITRRRAERGIVAALLALAAGGVCAQDLSLPQGAAMTREFTKDPGAYDMPVGAWTRRGGLPTQRVEGAVSAQSWRIEGSGLTPLQVMAPLRAQLEQQGFQIVLDCVAQACGGFDFRFATLVLPAPQMFVDLTDYQVLSAMTPEGNGVSLLASRDVNSAYLQIIRAGGKAATAPVKSDAAPVRAQAAPTGDVAIALESRGHVILDDLLFQTGAATPGAGAIASLDAIADYLKANPARRILFVGHTDAVGSLEGNQALSRKRALSAVDYLGREHGIPPAQIGADGVGFLSPVASNLTAEGRKANRRVEAVLISTE